MMKNLISLPILGLLINAIVWGLSWIAFQDAAARGLHPLWMTAAINGFAVLVLCAYRPRVLGEVFRTPALLGVLVAAGLTNVCFNTAVTVGDVLRVTLLFYLMPVWAALLAHWFLGEKLDLTAGLRLAVGLCGAGLVLWSTKTGLPVPQGWGDWLGIAGGVGFALNNVMLRRAHAASDTGRGIAMFVGGFLCSAVLAAILAGLGYMTWPSQIPTIHYSDIVLNLVFWSVLFFAANMGVQYGAARLPANLTALIMLFEVAVAAVSSIALGAAVLRWQDAVGGVLILAAPFLFSTLKNKDA